MRKYLILTAVIILCACSTIQELYADVPKGVAEAQATLAAAEHTALIYVNLPVCGKTAATLCRSPDITKKIGTADTIAYNAVQAARQAETQNTLDAALTALKLLTSITDNLPTGVAQ